MKLIHQVNAKSGQRSRRRRASGSTVSPIASAPTGLPTEPCWFGQPDKAPSVYERDRLGLGELRITARPSADSHPLLAARVVPDFSRLNTVCACCGLAVDVLKLVTPTLRRISVALKRIMTSFGRLVGRRKLVKPSSQRFAGIQKLVKTLFGRIATDLKAARTSF